MSGYNLGEARGRIVLETDFSSLSEAEQALKNFQGAGQKTADTVGGQSEAIKKSLNTSANAAGVAGATIAAGFGYAIKSASDFQFTMSQVQAVSGASSSQMEQISKAALRIGADTTFSADQAGQAFEELVKAGVSVEDALGGAADATVALAAAGQIDLPEAAAIASNAMNQFNLAAADLPNVANKIAGAANASAIDVSDFGNSISQVGAVANLVGASFDDTATAIALMGNAGIKGSDAGTSLKTMLTNLNPSTKEAATLMQQLGIITADGSNQFYDAQGNLKGLADVSGVLQNALKGMTKQQQQATLTTLFGADAIRGAAILANQGADGFDKMADAMGKVTAADVASARMNNLQGAMEALSGSVETTAILIGTPLLNGLTKIINVINNVVDGFSQMSSVTRGIIAGVVGAVGGMLLLAAAGIKVGLAMASARTTLLAATGATQLLGASGAIAAARTKALAAAQAVLNAVLRKSPLILIIATIALLVAGFVRLYNSSKPLQQVMAALGSVIGTVFKALSPIVTALGAAFGKVGEAMSGAFTKGTAAASGGILSVLVPAIANLVKFIASLVPGIAAFAGQVAVGITRMSATAGPAIGALISVIGGLFTKLAPVVSAALGTLATALAPVISSLAATFAQLAPVIAQTASVIASALGGALATILPVLAQVASTVVSQLIPPLLSMVSQVLPPLLQAFASLLPVLVQIVGAIVSAAGTVLSSLVPAFASILSAVVPVVATLVGQLLPVFAQIVAAVVPLVTTLISTLLPVFAQIIAAVVPVITTLIGQLVPVFAQIVAAVLPVVTAIITTLLPVFAQLIAVIAPLVATIVSVLLPVFTAIITAIMPLVTTILGVLIPVFTQIAAVVTTVMAAIVPIIEAAMQIIEGVINVVMGVISGNWSQVWTGIQEILGGVWNAIVAVISGAIAVVGSVISAGLNIVGSVVSTVMNTVKTLFTTAFSTASSAVSTAVSAISGFVSNMASAIGTGISNAVAFFTALPGKITSAVSGMGTLLVSVGRNLMQGFIDGVGGFARRMIDAVTAPISGAINAAKGLLGIHSPSRVFHQIGVYVGQGFANGVNTTVKNIKSASTKMSNAIYSAFSSGQINRQQYNLLTAANKTFTTNLTKMAAQQEKLADRLKTAQKNLAAVQKERLKFARDVRDKAIDEVNAADQGNAKGYILNLKDQISRVKEFAKVIADLRKKGLDKGSYSDLVEAGPDSLEVAKELQKGGKSAIKQIASLRNSLNSAASSLGSTAAKNLYDVGRDSAAGIVAGIQSQQKALNAAMRKAGQAMVNTIKKQLDIHSPSRLFEDEVGAMIPAGMEKGVSGNLKSLLASGRTLVQSLMQGVSSQYPDFQAQLNDVASLVPADLRQTVTANVESNKAQAAEKTGNTFVQNNRIYTDENPVLWARAAGREYEQQMIGVPV